MNLYLAACYTNAYMPGQNRHLKLNDHEKEITKNLPNILESYQYVGSQRIVDQMRADGAKVFLDSGAFSAHSLGVAISIEDYCEYIKRNMDILRVEDGAVMASVLDGIGDPLQTWRNQLEMELRGAKPLPCFHFGEDTRYLDWYIERYDYITIGGMVGKSTDTLITWLDRIWDKNLIDGAGNAKIKVHAFGITSVSIMERYPWYSCDSSSWIQSAAFGSIVSPDYGPLSVSEKSPSRHDFGRHVTTLTQPEQDHVLAMLERQGFTMERLSTVYESRAAYNLWSYGIINAMVNAGKAKGKHIMAQELF